jgi:serine/threonine-protein kinase HipA
MNRRIGTILDRWAAVCAEAAVTEVERNLMGRHRFLNRFAFIDAPADVRLPND